jgi:DNA-binding LacI/PurR family transcriptional regulator
MGNEITIKHLAEKLGLSKSTVSRAFQEKEGIHPDTRRRVLDLAKELDFRPSNLARSLKVKKTNTVGVLIPDYRIPFYSQAISGIFDQLAREGIHMMTCQSGENYEQEIAVLDTLLDARVDGLLISISRETKDLSHLKRLKEKGLPLVVFNRVTPELDVSQVFVDDYDGAYRLTRFIISKGNRQVFHMAGPEGLLLSMQREKGYRDAMSDEKIKVQKDWISRGDFSMASGYDIMKAIIKTGKLPDAIFVVCDAMAFGAIKACREEGIRIPEDMAIGGFTDEPAASIIDPPLTTVSQPIYEIGVHAADLLLKQIRGSQTPEMIRLKTHLKIRSSV